MKKEIIIGSKIETNKSFKPVDENEVEIKLEEKNITGTVISKHLGLYTIMFEKEYPFTHYLMDSSFKEPVFCWLSEKEFNVVAEPEIKDTQNKEIVSYFISKKYELLTKTPSEIKVAKTDFTSLERNAKSIERDMNNYVNRLKSISLKIKRLENKLSFSELDTDAIVNQTEKLLDNPKIQDLKIVNAADNSEVIVLTTKDLYFVDYERDYPTFNLGAYKIVFREDCEGNPIVRAFNFKKSFKNGDYSHPCVAGDGSLCLGANIKERISILLDKYKILQAASLLIDFLEEPNYGTPYIDAREFALAQEINSSLDTNVVDFFFGSIRPSNWNTKRYNNEGAKISGKFTGSVLSEKEREEKLAALDSEEKIINAAEEFEKLIK